MKRLPIMLAAAALGGGWSAARAQDFTSTRTDCSGLQLFSAAGLPDGEAHKYRFRGICRELETDDDNKVVQVRWEGWVEIESRYDVKTAMLDESAKVTMSGVSDGPASGTATLRLKCANDPMLPPPGGASSSCTIMKANTTTAWPDFVAAWKQGKPFTRGKVTLAQAVALSKSPAATPPPPPPPPANSAPQRATLTPRAKPAPQRAMLPPPTLTELPLGENAAFKLQNGRTLAAQPLDGELRWNILGTGGEVLRTFPEGSRAYRNGKGEVLVNWGGGTFNAGTIQTGSRLRLP